AALAPLADVGLDYLRLGQPVPTLSGGEAQRLKLAGHLAEAAQKKKGRKPALASTTQTADESGLLFLFDEPTTGLHFEDVATLLGAFNKLLEAGNSLIVIEHNLDVIAASDWVIDLGPEGGEEGGAIVIEGSAAEVRAHAASHTGAALRDYAAALEQTRGAVALVAEPRATYRQLVAPAIEIHHAREHNLKNISVSIPRDRFTVVTGLSGSGKSTLAFDIVFGEGQRRYLESLNAYARQFVQPASRPDVDGVFGIPPTVAIEQRTSRGGRKSTVATLTEIHPFLRLMYVKLGTQYCPDCQVPVTPQSFEAIVAQIQRELRGASAELLAPLVSNRKGLYTDLAKWARGKGHTQLRVDGEYLPTAKWPRLDRYKEHSIELPVGMLKVEPENEARLRELVREALAHGKGVLKVLELGKFGAVAVTFSTLRACPSCGTGFPEPDPRLFSYNAKHGWCPKCYGTGLKTTARVEDPDALDLGDAEDTVSSDETCPACEGARLNPVARAVRFRDRGLHQLATFPVHRAAEFFAELVLNERETDIGRDLLSEIR
ncbi:MAG: excinuclease ABC subunit A, partial [Betaproteobacteria bacterium HGW-Betaproteobacteria-21]